MGCLLLSSWALWRRLTPLPCSSVCGLHCTGPTKVRQSQWETVISCAGGQVFPGPLWLRIVSDASGFFLPQVVAKELSMITVSFWLRMPLSRVCWLSVTERSVLCPLSSVRSCCRSVSSLRRTCCYPGGRGRMWRSRSSLRGLLRGSCPSVPHSLPPVLCGGVADSGLTRACSPGHITAYDLETGPWTLLPRSFSCHLPPSHGMARLGVRACLHILKCCLYCFLEILDFISLESLVPS